MGEKYKIKAGKGGTVKLPEEVRRLFGVREGREFIVDITVDGILITPVWDERMEVYTDERIAEFLLNNAIGEDEYWDMRKEVVKLGFDPDKILHMKPDGTLVGDNEFGQTIAGVEIIQPAEYLKRNPL